MAWASRLEIQASAIFAPAARSGVALDLVDLVDLVDFAGDLGVLFVFGRLGWGVVGSGLMSSEGRLRLRAMFAGEAGSVLTFGLGLVGSRPEAGGLVEDLVVRMVAVV